MCKQALVLAPDKMGHLTLFSILPPDLHLIQRGKVAAA